MKLPALWPSKFRGRLFLTFMAVMAVPLSLTFWALVTTLTTSLRDETFAQLQFVRDAKHAEIEQYLLFSLRQAEYPADLEIAYPERMSRGLVLVKWLLALPHLIVVGLLGGTIMLYPIAALNDLGGDLQFLGGYSVLNLLVVIAGFFLLITGSYPGSLFDVLMGINRWMYRVLIYTALMTDQYPPFRLDAGATEKELS